VNFLTFKRNSLVLTKRKALEMDSKKIRRFDEASRTKGRKVEGNRRARSCSSEARSCCMSKELAQGARARQHDHTAYL